MLTLYILVQRIQKLATKETQGNSLQVNNEKSADFLAKGSSFFSFNFFIYKSQIQKGNILISKAFPAHWHAILETFGDTPLQFRTSQKNLM